MSFVTVLRILDEIAKTSSTNDKVAVIKRYSNDALFNRVCHYALNPFYAFNIREIRPSPIIVRKPTTSSIFGFLDILRTQRGATEEDRKMLARLSSIDSATVEVVNRILKKDLRCGASAKLFNKADFGIPQHSPMLCLDGSPSKESERNKNREKFAKLAKKPSNTCWSVKKNGVRVWAVVFANGNIDYVSRSGKTPPNFSVFNEALLKRREHICSILETDFPVVIFDGESDTTEKTFKSVMQNFRRIKDADSTKYRFNIFDIVLDDIPFKDRYNLVTQINEGMTDNVSFVEHTTLESFAQMYDILDEQDSLGEEGIVVKCWNSPYERKRSNYWMKLKKFFSDEFKVIGWEYGKGKYANCVGAIHIDVNGKLVKVSPRTDRDRIDYLKNLPKLVEVRYKEMTDDGSLLFPTITTVRDDK